MIREWFYKRINIQKPNGRRLAAIQRKRGGNRDFNFIHLNPTLSNLTVGKLNFALPAVQQRSLPDFLPLTRAGALPTILPFITAVFI